MGSDALTAGAGPATADLRARLAALRRRRTMTALVRGVLMTALLVLVSVFAALIFEEALRPGTTVRTVAFWILDVGSLALLGWQVGRPLLRLLRITPDLNDGQLASLVGSTFPGIKDRFANVLQLCTPGAAEGLYSGELVSAALEDLRRDLAPLDLLAAIDTSGARRIGRLLGLAAVSVGLLFLISPSPFLGSAERLWKHNQVFAGPVSIGFLVDPGDREVVKGETVTVTVRVQGDPRREILLSSRPEGQISFDEHTLRPSTDGLFRYAFPPLRYTTAYFVSAGGVDSRTFTLKVTDRPVVKLLQVGLVYPSYAQLPPRQLDDNIGDITALKGTRATIHVQSNKALAAAFLVFHDSTRLPLRVDGSTATGRLMLLKDGSYHLLLTDSDGVPNADPIEYTMRVVADAYPTVSIPVPGTDLDVTDNSSLNVVCRIADDYGFSRLRLAYRLVHSRYEQPAENFTYADIRLPEHAGTEALVSYTWDLSRLHLVPEDVVQYHAEVFDNDNISGPKSAVSETYTLRLPSTDEVFRDVDRAHDESLAGLQDAMQQAEQARKELEDLRQDMKEHQDRVDWQEQKKAEDLLAKYQDAQKKVEEASRAVNTMIDAMEKNKTLSPETLEKYLELRQMLEQMNSPELAEAMKQLNQALQQMSPEALREAMKQFTFSEEAFRKSIERTMNLLKRIQVEQKIDEALKRAGELMKNQAEVQKKSERAAPQDTGALNDLARRQKDLADELAQLRKELEDLKAKMEEFPAEMPLARMDSTMRDLQQSGMEQDMQDAARELAQRQPQQASAGQQQALAKMGKFFSQLQRMQEEMRQNQQQQVLNAMRRSMQDLLELSQREEALKDESRSLEPGSQRFRENAERQMDVMRDLGSVTDGLAGLSQKTFTVTPEMGKALGDALRQMGDAMQSLQQRNGGAAGQQQEGAMGSLNEAAQMLGSAVNALRQGGGQGMGMAGFLQRLSQMSGQQQGINQGTRNLGSLSQQQAAEMARLAGEQGAVRKSLEQLSKEAAGAGELKRLLGDLNRVAQDMREVQTDLAQGNITPETLNKQDRILSRLLDAQRSMNARDFESRRRSEPGTDVARRTPPPLELSRQADREQLRRDLLKAMEEGYAPDYQELIRKYFDALEQTGKPPTGPPTTPDR